MPASAAAVAGPAFWTARRLVTHGCLHRTGFPVLYATWRGGGSDPAAAPVHAVGAGDRACQPRHRGDRAAGAGGVPARGRARTRRRRRRRRRPSSARRWRSRPPTRSSRSPVGRRHHGDQQHHDPARRRGAGRCQGRARARRGHRARASRTATSSIRRPPGAWRSRASRRSTPASARTARSPSRRRSRRLPASRTWMKAPSSSPPQPPGNTSPAEGRRQAGAGLHQVQRQVPDQVIQTPHPGCGTSFVDSRKTMENQVAAAAPHRHH